LAANEKNKTFSESQGDGREPEFRGPGGRAVAVAAASMRAGTVRAAAESGREAA
jgi:hypothetical protein